MHVAMTFAALHNSLEALKFLIEEAKADAAVCDDVGIQRMKFISNSLIDSHSLERSYCASLCSQDGKYFHV